MKPGRDEGAIARVLGDTCRGSILGLALLVWIARCANNRGKILYGYLLLQSTDNTELDATRLACRKNNTTSKYQEGYGWEAAALC